MPIKSEVLIFKVETGKYAIDLDLLVELIQMVEINDIPNKSGFMMGAINYRGQMVPLYDLSLLLGGCALGTDIYNQVFVVKINDNLVSFSVKEVLGVEDREALTKIDVAQNKDPLVEEAYKYQDDIVLKVNIGKILEEAEKKEAGQGHSHVYDAKDLLPVEQEIIKQRTASLGKKITNMESVTYKYTCFKLAGRCYGVGIEYLDAVMAFKKVCELPGQPEVVLGVFNKRGEICSVTDLLAFLGLGRSKIGKNTAFVVVKNRDMETAFFADEVRGVINLKSDEIKKAPAGLEASLNDYVKGVVEMNGELIIILDVGRILSSNRLQAIGA